MATFMYSGANSRPKEKVVEDIHGRKVDKKEQSELWAEWRRLFLINHLEPCVIREMNKQAISINAVKRMREIPREFNEIVINDLEEIWNEKMDEPWPHKIN